MLTHSGILGGATRYNPVIALGSDLLGNWNADRLDLITQSASVVSSWKSIVGGYNASATTTAQPTYSASSFNGSPGMSFDGVANCLTLASEPFPSGANTSEIWAVVENDSLPADTTPREIVAYGGGSSTSRRSICRTVTSGVNRGRAENATGAAGVDRVGTLIDFSTRHVVRGIFGSANTDLWVDGIYEGSVACSPGTGTTRFRIGASANDTVASFFKGIVRDVMVTNLLGNIYTDSRTAVLHNYLMARRNVAALPVYFRAVAIAPDKVSLGWDPFGTGTTSYSVFRNGVRIASGIAPGDLSYTDTGLSPSTSYTYTMAAITPTGTVWSASL